MSQDSQYTEYVRLSAKLGWMVMGFPAWSTMNEARKGQRITMLNNAIASQEEERKFGEDNFVDDTR